VASAGVRTPASGVSQKSSAKRDERALFYSKEPYEHVRTSGSALK